MNTRCQKCRDLPAQCADCRKVDDIVYYPAPVPVDPIVFHGPAFGVSQAQHAAVIAERDALKVLLDHSRTDAKQCAYIFEQRKEALRNEVARLREALERLIKRAEDLAWPEEELAKYREALPSGTFQGVKPRCDHNWVPADNDGVIHASICTKCKILRAADEG